MSGLGQFYRSRTEGERVIGTYLYPLCLFGEPDWHDAYSATEVVASVQVESSEILITRMSGVFVRPPEDLSNPYTQPIEAPAADDLHAKLAFEEHAAQAFNRLICEFCLRGVISQPTSPVHISYAQLIEQHALITGAGGGRESYLERSMAPSVALLRGDWMTWRIQSETVLQEVVPLRLANHLADISSSLPEFVAGAYALYSQRQINEALADSWIVCEQLLDHLWQEYSASLKDRQRQRRLADTRSYSAAVRLEVLKTAAVLPDSLYGALNAAREHRNKLLHRAETSVDAASDCVNAMKMVLEHILGEDVAQPQVSQGVTW